MMMYKQKMISIKSIRKSLLLFSCSLEQNYYFWPQGGTIVESFWRPVDDWR